MTAYLVEDRRQELGTPNPSLRSKMSICAIAHQVAAPLQALRPWLAIEAWELDVPPWSWQVFLLESIRRGVGASTQGVCSSKPERRALAAAKKGGREQRPSSVLILGLLLAVGASRGTLTGANRYEAMKERCHASREYATRCGVCAVCWLRPDHLLSRPPPSVSEVVCPNDREATMNKAFHSQPELQLPVDQ